MNEDSVLDLKLREEENLSLSSSDSDFDSMLISSDYPSMKELVSENGVFLVALLSFFFKIMPQIDFLLQDDRSPFRVSFQGRC